MNLFFILFFVALGLSILSMGMLGAVLFFIATPAINLFNGTSIPLSLTGLDQKPFACLNGDSTWTTLIVAGILWSMGFLLLAVIKWKFKGFDMTLYIGSPLFLWAWAALTWQFLIEVNLF